MPVQISADQNQLIVFTKFIFDSGLTIITYASPLSPETGREILGSHTENDVLIGLMRPVSRAYPMLRATVIAEPYIRSTLGIDPPVSGFMFALMPYLTDFVIPDQLALVADRWYRDYQF